MLPPPSAPLFGRMCLWLKSEISWVRNRSEGFRGTCVVCSVSQARSLNSSLKEMILNLFQIQRLRFGQLSQLKTRVLERFWMASTCLKREQCMTLTNMTQLQKQEPKSKSTVGSSWTIKDIYIEKKKSQKQKTEQNKNPVQINT